MHTTFKLLMKFYIGLMILSSGLFSFEAARATTLKCAGIFSPSVRAGEIDRAVQELAKIKMQIDVALGRGGLSVIEKKWQSIYLTKKAELENKLGSQFSEAQVRQMITNKILELQGLKEVDGLKEAEHRNVEARSFAIQKPYEKEKRIEFSSSDDIKEIKNLKYIEKAQSLFFISGNNLVQVHLPTGEVKKIKDNVLKLSATADELLIWNNNDEVYRFDPMSETHTAVILKNRKIQGNKILAPQGDAVAVVSDRVRFFDSKTGLEFPHSFTEWVLKKSLKNFFKQPAELPTISDVRFISDEEVIVTGQIGKKVTDLIKFNFKTGERLSIDTGTFAFKDFTVNLRNKELFFYSNEAIAKIQVKDLSNFTQNAQVRVMTEILPELSSGFGWMNKVESLYGNELFVHTVARGETIKILDSRSLGWLNDLGPTVSTRVKSIESSIETSTLSGSILSIEDRIFERGSIERRYYPIAFYIDIWQRVVDK